MMASPTPTAVAEAYDGLAFVLPLGVIHGDASVAARRNRTDDSDAAIDLSVVLAPVTVTALAGYALAWWRDGRHGGSTRPPPGVRDHAVPSADTPAAEGAATPSYGTRGHRGAPGQADGIPPGLRRVANPAPLICDTPGA
jgi:hypothetical protein